MDLKTVFELIGCLTSQTNTKELTVVLSELLKAHFSGAQVVVYEVQTSRSGKSSRNCIIGMDTLHLKAPMYLDQHEAVMDAYQTKREVSSKNSIGQSLLILPVELYDTNLSHIIVSTHRYSLGSTYDMYRGLLKIFTDIFRNLHEKGYDPLTRILNRQAFDQTIIKLAYSASINKETAHRYGRGYGSIAIIDIDNFKQINDKFGHPIGDETLVLFAQTIRAVLRQEDMFFRYGGEEFVIFVKEPNDEKTLAILERCRQAIENRRFPQVTSITVSIGLALLNPLQEHPSGSLSKADKALYYAKENGKNQVRSYEKLIDHNLIQAIEVQRGSADFWE